MHDLLRPLTFPCGATAKNRLWLAPLTNQQSHPDGRLSEDERRWLLRRAEGGFGVIETAAAFVQPDGKAWAGEVGVADEAHEQALRPLAQGLHEQGALGVVQLFHGGARAPSALTGQRPWSASAFEEDTPGFEVPREADEAMVDRVIEAFADAAARCAREGLGGVELHGAHGYLLGQFLSRTMNQRTDRYGGDLEGRARLLRTVVQRVRARVPAPFVVGVRLSPEDRGQARGLDLDESLAVAHALAQDGIDFLHLSLWDGRAPTAKRPGVHPLPLFREAVGAQVPLVACGGVWTRDDAQFLVDQGADLVAVGRAAIGDPSWPLHVIAQDEEPVRPPYDDARLAQVDVSAPFRVYLRRFRGLVAEPPT